MALFSLEELAHLLDDCMMTTDDKCPFEEILQHKGNKSFKELLAALSDSIEKDILMVMLYHLPTTPEIRQHVQKQTELNLSDFKTMEDGFLYIDAIVSSGARQEAKATVCVLGNTTVGKSSLTRTLRDYCNNPNETPKSNLTGDPANAEFVETKVLELVDNVELKPNTFPNLDIQPNGKNFSTISSNKTKPNNDKINGPDKIIMTFLDFGGHSPYASCSPIFLKEKGVYIICFDPKKFQEDIKDAYFKSIGTYLELVTERCPTAIFLLVATKTDECDDNVPYSTILTTAKKHLKSIAAQSNSLKHAFIFNEIIQTSSAVVTKDSLDGLVSKIVAICCHEQLMNTQLRNMPNSWARMMRHLRTKLQVSLEEIDQIYKAVFQKCEATEVVAGLEGWREVARKLVKLSEKASASRGKCTEEVVVQLVSKDTKKPKNEKAKKTKKSKKKYANKIELEETVTKGDGEPDMPFVVSKDVETILNIYTSFNEIFWFR